METIEVNQIDERVLGCKASEIVSQLPQRISTGILRWASDLPDDPAVVSNRRIVTYRELGELVAETRENLSRHGVRPGDRVMLVSENGLSLVVLFLALSEMDAVSVVVNARLSEREINEIHADCAPRCTIYTTLDSSDAEQHARRDGAADFADSMISSCVASTSTPVAESGADQVAAMIYTTGTTGSPKGVMLTHQNLSFIAFVSGRLRSISRGDTVYCVLPMSHVFGLSAVCFSVLFSAGCAYLETRFSAAKAVATLEQEAIAGFLGVPTMYALILEQLGDRQLRSPQLRFLYSGGAPLDPTLKSRVQVLFGMPLHNGYGLTESGPTICQTRLYAPLDSCSVGFPLPGVDTRILNREGARVKPGEIGELWARGPNIMKGYFGRPELTAEVLVDGWFNTQDLVFEDTDGGINIAGRSKELIIHSGFNVYPPEVEAALNAHPQIAISAVVGRSVPGNEEIVAFVQSVGGVKLDREALENHLRKLLAGYKMPVEIIQMQTLPAAPSGKILKHKLLNML